MSRGLAIFLIIMFAGCSYVDDPKSIIRDPHYTDYKDDLEDVERAYLRKEIDFADYQIKKKNLEDKYNREVQKRESIIIGR